MEFELLVFSVGATAIFYFICVLLNSVGATAVFILYVCY